MSTTLNSEPPAVVPVGNCVNFQLQLSDGGADPIVKYMLYRLRSGLGIELTGIEQIGYTGLPEPLDFSRQLRNEVSTTVPTPGDGAIAEDPAMVAPYYLEYGHLEFNKNTCEETTYLTNTTATKRVINSAFPWWKSQAELLSLPVVLNSKPSRQVVYPGQNDWIYAFRVSGTIGFRATCYDSSANVLSDQSADRTAGNSVYRWPVGPGNAWFPIPAGTAYYDIQVFDGASSLIQALPEGGEEFHALAGTLVWSTRYVLQGCQTPSGATPQILFLDPLGGYNGLAFPDLRTSQAVTSARYASTAPCGATGWQATQRGLSRANLKPQRRMTVSKELQYQEGADLYLEAFFSAGQHYFVRTLPDGTVAAERMNLVDGDFVTNDTRGAVLMEATLESTLYTKNVLG